MKPLTAFFPMTIKVGKKLRNVIVELTDGSADFKIVDANEQFESWQVARDVAFARNRTIKHLTFSQQDAIYAGVLLAQEQERLIREAGYWRCVNGHINPPFRHICPDCGASLPVEAPRKKKGRRG